MMPYTQRLSLRKKHTCNVLMTGVILGGRGRLPKEEVAEKGAQGNSNHDPAVVRHENEPTGMVM